MTPYYSNGKLLITGEYLVMLGARSLALPVKYGQSLELTEGDRPNKLHWESSEYGYIGTEPSASSFLFKANINPVDWTVKHEACEIDSSFLLSVLKAADRLNPEFSARVTGKKIATTLNFNHNWGLGSSSSLISNIAYLADIDPFALHFRVSKGSGYDIACARSNTPIIYTLKDQQPDVRQVEFNPTFHEQLYFLYLGKKQDSAASVRNFLNSKIYLKNEISSVSEISTSLLTCRELRDFDYHIREHESILSAILKRKKIKEEFFPSFDGEIKSLGAWGGDFALVSSQQDQNRIEDYFKGKGLDTIIKFADIKI